MKGREEKVVPKGSPLTFSSTLRRLCTYTVKTLKHTLMGHTHTCTCMQKLASFAPHARLLFLGTHLDSLQLSSQVLISGNEAPEFRFYMTKKKYFIAYVILFWNLFVLSGLYYVYKCIAITYLCFKKSKLCNDF